MRKYYFYYYLIVYFLYKKTTFDNSKFHFSAVQYSMSFTNTK